MDSPNKGYRRIQDDLEHYHRIKANDKRVLWICRKKEIRSTIKYSNNGCTRQAANPQFIAKNVLIRDFAAEAQNQKWLTDVTKFKQYDGNKDKYKVYSILALYDRWIVTYVISGHNDNPLVFNTFDKAIAANLGATPFVILIEDFNIPIETFISNLRLQVWV